MFNRWNYNAFESGGQTAKSLGVNVNVVTYVGMAVCSLVASVVVAFVGIISFVGLLAPHIMRRFIGNDYRFLPPTSALTGAVLLLTADTFGRFNCCPYHFTHRRHYLISGRASYFFIYYLKELEKHDRNQGYRIRVSLQKHFA